MEIWPEYTCLYDVSSSDLKNREKHEQVYSELAKKLDQTGTVQWDQVGYQLTDSQLTSICCHNPISA